MGPAVVGTWGDQNQLLAGGRQGPGSQGRDKEPKAGSGHPGRAAEDTLLAGGCLAVGFQGQAGGVKVRG